MKKNIFFDNSAVHPYVNFSTIFPKNFALTFKVKFVTLDPNNADTNSGYKSKTFGVGRSSSLDTSNSVYITEGINYNNGNFNVILNGTKYLSFSKSNIPLNTWIDFIMFIKDNKVSVKVLADINNALYSSNSIDCDSTRKSEPFLTKGGVSSYPCDYYIDDIRIWDTTDLTFLQVEKYDQIYNLNLNSTDTPKLLHRIITKNGALQCVGAIQESVNWKNGTPTYVNMDMYPYSDRNVIIKDNGKYYSFKSDNYDTSAMMYKEISSLDANNFDDYAEGSPALCESVTIGTETFRPIDKFTDPHIIIQDNKDIAVTGIKKDAGMAVLLTPISFKRFSKIKELAATKTLSTTSQIKLVFSFDNGASWYTYPNLIDKWKSINVDIPLKQFSKLNSTEKQAWENSKAEILSNGIDINNINIVEDITTDMMIAIVVKIDSYSSVATLNNIQVTYDGAKTLSRLDNSECGVTIEGDTITLTPQVTCDELLLSIITSF